ncbi:MAG: cache domain-containing protein [Spirochaetes bacterium]|nr:cache domain-containing protein [Spirochaetota bacterium]
MKHIFRSNIRFKLIVSLLSIVFITGTLSIIIGITIINKSIIREAYDNVQTSLDAAYYLYNEEIQNRSKTIEYLSNTTEIINATATRNRQYLYGKLLQIKREFNFDIVNVVDADGRILVRANNYDKYGDDVSEYQYIRWVKEHRKSSFGTDVLQYEKIKYEGEDLARKTVIKVIHTPHAMPRSSLTETRAMVIKVASPIIDRDRIVGTLYASVILNNNYRLIDKFKGLVFRKERIDGRDVGTTTIFLKDLRITTNVVDEKGNRAIGTLVSEEVYRRVYEQGKVWLDKAFVVNRWYLSGYRPIYDINGHVLGILYVGILEEKYRNILRNTTLSFLVVIVITTVIAIVIAIYLVNTFLKPVRRVLSASANITLGKYTKIEVKPGDDEDTRKISRALNKMVDAVKERDCQLQEQAEQTIVKSEKLASLGRLASGIAHEINNPLTGVLTYSSILLEELKETEYADDLRVIRDETIRCREIVKGILDFARESKIDKVRANINTIIIECLMILEKHMHFQNIIISRKFDPSLPEVFVDINQIKQVVNNLSVNAADAMPKGGYLTITTGIEENPPMVVIKFLDTGTGIDEENLGKIFDPFFTTKETGKGTGLGLAVTYGIIKRHNGTIDVRSTVGEGTEFIIKLPLQ